MRFFRVVTAIFFLAGAIASAQSSPGATSTAPVAASAQAPSLEVSNLPQHLDAARYALHVENGVLSGPGAAVLTEAIARSRYVLIGEDHLTREIPSSPRASAISRQSRGRSPAWRWRSAPKPPPS